MGAQQKFLRPTQAVPLDANTSEMLGQMPVNLDTNNAAMLGQMPAPKRMTRAEFVSRFGREPQAAPPKQMTRDQFEAQYGRPPSATPLPPRAPMSEELPQAPGIVDSFTQGLGSGVVGQNIRQDATKPISKYELAFANYQRTGEMTREARAYIDAQEAAQPGFLARIASGVGSLVGTLPEALAGGGIGGAVGTAIAGPAGGIIGSGIGAMSAIRGGGAYMQDQPAQEVAKQAAIGAGEGAVMGAAGLGGRVLGGAITGAASATPGLGRVGGLISGAAESLGKNASRAAITGEHIGAAVGGAAPAFLEGDHQAAFDNMLLGIAMPTIGMLTSKGMGLSIRGAKSVISGVKKGTDPIEAINAARAKENMGPITDPRKLIGYDDKRPLQIGLDSPDAYPAIPIEPRSVYPPIAMGQRSEPKFFGEAQGAKDIPALGAPEIPNFMEGDTPYPMAPNAGTQGAGPVYSPNIPKQLMEYETLINQSADKHGVPPELIAAVMKQESNGQADAVSPAGASGLMMLMPDTARELGVTDIADPAQNIDAGAAYLRRALDRHNGDIDLALSDYNAGPGNVDKYGGVPPFKETQDYIQRVRNNMNEMSRINTENPVQTQGGRGQTAIPGLEGAALSSEQIDTLAPHVGSREAAAEFIRGVKEQDLTTREEGGLTGIAYQYLPDAESPSDIPKPMMDFMRMERKLQQLRKAREAKGNPLTRNEAKQIVGGTREKVAPMIDQIEQEVASGNTKETKNGQEEGRQAQVLNETGEGKTSPAQIEYTALSAFPDMYEVDGGGYAINNFSPNEIESIRKAGGVYVNENGHEVVDAELLWEQRREAQKLPLEEQQRLYNESNERKFYKNKDSGKPVFDTPYDTAIELGFSDQQYRQEVMTAWQNGQKISESVKDSLPDLRWLLDQDPPSNKNNAGAIEKPKPATVSADAAPVSDREQTLSNLKANEDLARANLLKANAPGDSLVGERLAAELKDAVQKRKAFEAQSPTKGVNMDATLSNIADAVATDKPAEGVRGVMPGETAKEQRRRLSREAAAVRDKFKKESLTPVDKSITSQWKRDSAPQVSQPTVMGIATVTTPLGETLKGKELLIPGWEEYKFVVVPPRGSKAKSNLAPHSIYEATTGRLLSTSVAPAKSAGDTMMNAAMNTKQQLDRLGKNGLDHSIQKHLGKLDSSVMPGEGKAEVVPATSAKAKAVAKKAAGEKTDKYGFTPSQKDYLSSELTKWAKSEPEGPVTIRVPGDGTVTPESPAAASAIVKRLTGKPIAGVEPKAIKHEGVSIPKADTYGPARDNEFSAGETQSIESQVNDIRIQRQGGPKYYAFDPKEKKAIPVIGKSVVIDGVDGDLFSHKNISGTGYAISEGSTGLRIGTGKSIAEAIADAKKSLGEDPQRKLNTAIRIAREKGHKTPRYTEDVPAPPTQPATPTAPKWTKTSPTSHAATVGQDAMQIIRDSDGTYMVQKNGDTQSLGHKTLGEAKAAAAGVEPPASKPRGKRGANPRNPEAGVVDANMPIEVAKALYSLGKRGFNAAFVGPGTKAERAGFTNAKNIRSGIVNASNYVKRTKVGDLRYALKKDFGRDTEMREKARKLISGVISGDMKLAIADKSMTRERQAQLFDSALSGKSNIVPVSQRMADAVIAMRKELNNRQQEIIDRGLVKGDMATTVKDSIGFWTRRSYKVFEDSGWLKRVKGGKEWNAAIKYHMDEHNATVANPGRLSDAELMDFYRREFHAKGKKDTFMYEDGTLDPATRKAMEQEIRGLQQMTPEMAAGDISAMLQRQQGSSQSNYYMSKLDTQDRTSFMYRKNIPKPIRDVMGEVWEPELKYAKSQDILTKMIAADEFTKQLREHGLGDYIIDKGGRPTETLNAQIADTPEHGKLAGNYMSPELKDMITEAQSQTSGFMRVLNSISGGVRSMKTVYNIPAGAIRNTVGAAILSNFRNGSLPVNSVLRFIDHAKTNSLEDATAKTLGFKSAKDANYRKFHEKMSLLGVHDQSVEGNMFAENIRSGVLQDYTNIDKTEGRIARGLDATKNAWLAGDNLWKSLAWIETRARYENYAKKMGWTDAQLDRHAADVVRAINPTYDAAYPIANAVKKVPVLQDFTTWHFEVLRNNINLLKLIHDEWTSGDPTLRKSAAGRVVSTLAYRAAMTGGTLALAGYILGDNAQDKDWASRHLGPSWTKDSPRIPLGDNRFIDLAFTDSDQAINQPILRVAADAMRGNLGWETVWQAAKSALDPFVGSSILFDTASELWSGRNANGAPIYMKSDKGWEIAKKVGRYGAEKLGPPTVKLVTSGIEKAMGKKEETARPFEDRVQSALTGFSTYSIDPKRELSRRTSDAVARMAEIQSDFNKAVREWPGMDVNAEKQAAASEKDTYINNLVISGVASRMLGTSAKEVVESLDAGGLTRESANKVAKYIEDAYKKRITSVSELSHTSQDAGIKTEVKGQKKPGGLQLPKLPSMPRTVAIGGF